MSSDYLQLLASFEAAFALARPIETAREDVDAAIEKRLADRTPELTRRSNADRFEPSVDISIARSDISMPSAPCKRILQSAAKAVPGDKNVKDLRHLD